MVLCIASFLTPFPQAEMQKCIICFQISDQATVEHIIPKALGNVHYVLPKGKVCLSCNQRFSRYEHQVLNSGAWLYERSKFRLCSTEVEAGNDPDDRIYARFLLKTMYESLYHSKSKFFHSTNLEEVRYELLGKPGLEYHLFFDKGIGEGRHIPGWMDRWRLGRNGLSLRYCYDEKRLFFELVFGQIYSVIQCTFHS